MIYFMHKTQLKLNMFVTSEYLDKRTVTCCELNVWYCSNTLNYSDYVLRQYILIHGFVIRRKP